MADTAIHFSLRCFSLKCSMSVNVVYRTLKLKTEIFAASVGLFQVVIVEM